MYNETFLLGGGGGGGGKGKKKISYFGHSMENIYCGGRSTQ